MSPKVGIEPIRQTRIIVEATLQSIAEQGSHHVSIQSRATRSGLSKGVILHSYSTKDALFALVFREFFRQMFARSEAAMARHDDPLEKLRSIGDWLFADDDPIVSPGYPLYLECMARALYEKTFYHLFHEWVTTWVALIKSASKRETGGMNSRVSILRRLHWLSLHFAMGWLPAGI